MAELIYSGITTLDGYTADKDGNFDWLVPDPDVHTFINDSERSIGTYLYGRRLYEVMVAWETIDPASPDLPEPEREYAGIWQAADKVVYSRTLEAPSSAKTRIERDFDPEAVRRLKAEADRDLSIGGAELGGEALKAGLVDECQLYIFPIVIGGGKQFFPDDHVAELELTDQHRFENGVVSLRYRVKA